MKDSDLCLILKSILLRSKRLDSMKEMSKDTVSDEYDFYSSFIPKMKKLDKNKNSIDDIHNIRDSWIASNIDKCRQIISKEMIIENKKLLSKYTWFIENIDKMSESQILSEKKSKEQRQTGRVIQRNNSVVSSGDKFLDTIVSPVKGGSGGATKSSVKSSKKLTRRKAVSRKTPGISKIYRASSRC